MLVTSCTTEAGAATTGVYERLGVELEVSFTTTKTTTMMMTRPTEPQAIMAPEIRRGGVGAGGREPGRGRLPPPLAPPPPPPPPLRGAGPERPPGALVETGRLCALLRSLALWPLCGFGRLPPVPVFWPLAVFSCSRAIAT